MTLRENQTRQTTVRLPETLAVEATAVARTRGVSLNQLIIQSLKVEVDRAKSDDDFQARLALLIKQDREILRRLAERASPMMISNSPTSG